MNIGGKLRDRAALGVLAVLIAGCGPKILDDPTPIGTGGSSGTAGSPGSGGSGVPGNGGAGGAQPGAGGMPPECNFSFPPPLGDAGSSGADEECRCTRRPGDGNSFQCPMGAGVSVTATVGPAGGTVSLSGTPSTVGVSVDLKIPPNALTQDVSIRISETNVPPPEGFADWSPLYYFEPVDLTFNAPVEVRMPWKNTSGVVAEHMSLYWSEEPGGCALAPLSDNYQNAGFNQGSVRTLGWAIVGAPRSTSSTCP